RGARRYSCRGAERKPNQTGEIPRVPSKGQRRASARARQIKPQTASSSARSRSEFNVHTIRQQKLHATRGRSVVKTTSPRESTSHPGPAVKCRKRANVYRLSVGTAPARS